LNIVTILRPNHVRFRISDEAFTDTTPAGPDQKDGEKEGETKKSPYTITVWKNTCLSGSCVYVHEHLLIRHNKNVLYKVCVAQIILVIIDLNANIFTTTLLMY